MKTTLLYAGTLILPKAIPLGVLSMPLETIDALGEFL